MTDPDIVADYVAEGVAYLHRSDETKDRQAAASGISRDEYDRQWEEGKVAWTGLDPGDLTDEQYQALFDRPKP